MTKESVTFRLEPELVKRLRDTAAKSGGKLTQAEIVESALADRFAVRDGTKLLAKVNQDQATALTLVKEQTQAIEDFKERVKTGINGYAQRMHDDITKLQTTTQQELRSTTASVTALQSQMAGIVATMRQVEYAMERTAESKLSLLHWLGLVGLVLSSVIGVAALGFALWQRFVM